MGKKIIEIPQENEGFQKSWGGVHGALPQNLSLEWPSVWRRKIIEIPLENEGFQRSWGVMHGSASQNLSLE